MHSALGDAGRDTWLEFKSSPFGSLGTVTPTRMRSMSTRMGRRFLIDSGYYPWYGSPHDGLWSRRRALTMLFSWADEASLPGIGHARGRVESFAEAAPFAYARGEAAAAYNRPLHDDAVQLAQRHLPEFLDRMDRLPRCGARAAPY